MRIGANRRGNCFRLGLMLQAGLMIGAMGACSPDLRADEPDAPRAASRRGNPDRSVVRARDPRTLSDLLALQTSVQEQSRRVIPATVALQIGRAQGSGVIVTADGYILTAAHVSGEPGQRVTITLHDGRRVRGRTLGAERTSDAGMIKITDDGEWPHVELGDSDSVQIGQWCLAVGHPGGYQPGRPPVVRLGRVVARRETVIQSDCSLVGGDSGGPLFDLEGRVIGIHSRIGAARDWNFHVPMATYSSEWERLAASEIWQTRPPRAVLGVSGMDHDQGCLIMEVLPELPASEVDIQAGDVIVRLDGKPVEGIDGLRTLIQNRKAGDRITLRILRGMKEIERSVELAAWNR